MLVLYDSGSSSDDIGREKFFSSSKREDPNYATKEIHELLCD